MAFRLKRDGSMPKQLRRIVRSELRTALDELAEEATADAGAYEARKSVKKIRAILRLLRQPLASDYADENARLRRVAHALASIRDADVSLDTLHDLHARYPAAMSARVVRAVGHGLRTRERQARAEVPPLVRRAKAALLVSCQSVPAHIERAGGFRAARAGAVVGYRQARTAYRGLDVDAEATAFHEWRKRVKDHWYHVRLFARLPNGSRSRTDTLRRLEAWLGKDHDLAALRRLIVDGDDGFGDAKSRTLALGSITRRQASLRRRALTLGARVFAPTPKDFKASVTHWWRDR
jgi:CHAD domain-containing protein